MKRCLTSLAALALSCTAATAQEQLIDTRGVVDPYAYGPEIGDRMVRALLSQGEGRLRELGIRRILAPPAPRQKTEAVPGFQLRIGIPFGGGRPDRNPRSDVAGAEPTGGSRGGFTPSLGIDLTIPLPRFDEPETVTRPPAQSFDTGVAVAVPQVGQALTAPTAAIDIPGVAIPKKPRNSGKPQKPEPDETDDNVYETKMLGPGSNGAGQNLTDPRILGPDLTEVGQVLIPDLAGPFPNPSLPTTPPTGIVNAPVAPVNPVGGGTIPGSPPSAPGGITPTSTGGAPTSTSGQPAGSLFVCGEPDAQGPGAHGCAYYAILFTDDNQGGEQFCSGTVIGPRHVLTASHCFGKLTTASMLSPGQDISLYQSQTANGYFQQAWGRLPNEQVLAMGRGVPLAQAMFTFHPTRDLVLIALPDGLLRDGAYRAAARAGDYDPRWIAPIGQPDWAGIAAILPRRDAPIADDLWTRSAFSVFGALQRDGYREKAYGRTTVTAIDPAHATVKHDGLGLCNGDSGAGMYRRLPQSWQGEGRHAVVGVVSGTGQVTFCNAEEGYDARTITRLDGDIPAWIAATMNPTPARVTAERDGTLFAKDPGGVMYSSLGGR